MKITQREEEDAALYNNAAAKKKKLMLASAERAQFSGGVSASEGSVSKNASGSY